MFLSACNIDRIYYKKDDVTVVLSHFLELMVKKTSFTENGLWEEKHP